MVKEYPSVDEILAGPTANKYKDMGKIENNNQMGADYDHVRFRPKSLSLLQRCVGSIEDFSMGFAYGFYYRQKQTFDYSPIVDHTKRGMENLPKDDASGGIGISASLMGYGLGNLAGNPLVIAMTAVLGYGIYKDR